MKLILALALMLAGANSAMAAKSVDCKGFTPDGEHSMDLSIEDQDADGIYGLELTFKVFERPTLKLKSVDRDKNYEPKNPKYEGLHKFEVKARGEDCTHILLLPPVNKRAASFKGYSQTACDSYFEVHTLRCENN